MQTTKFRIKGAHVQQLLAGAGRAITARVIANMMLAQYGATLSDMIVRELEAKRSELPPEAGEHWPGYDLGLDLRLLIPALGWVAPRTPGVEGVDYFIDRSELAQQRLAERRIPRYEDQTGAVTVPQTEG